jgi:DMSO/TMAO reductase YedYZ molybdopterin-dependent catalytic subunit
MAMRFPWANSLLLILVALQALSGYFGFTTGRPPERWLLWLHGIGAYAVVLLLFWKSAIIVDVIGRGQRWSFRRLAFLVMLALLVLVLLSGLWWAFYGPRYLLGFSLISLHIFLAVGLLALVAWHTIAHRWILRQKASRDRRAFLNASALGAAGFVSWTLGGKATRLLAMPGASRRFTGSYERASFSPGFPNVSWINDRPDAIALESWRLAIDGTVRRPLLLEYEQLLTLARDGRQAILDCTGGWYSEQQWRGVSLAALLALAEPLPKSRSITCESITGYSRRFALEKADQILLATHVAGATLSHGHGFPLRLVVPGERGVHWVKWLTHIQLNATSHLLQPPLPLQ